MNDILIGTTSMYADYIFRDLTHLERWEFQGSHPNIPNKVGPVRQPSIAPVPEETKVFGQPVPLCFESMLMGIADHMNLPGFGKDAFGPDLDLNHPDDLYLRGVANMAFGESPDGSKQVPDANERKMNIFRAARKHLPKSVYDEERWKRIGEEKMWPKVVYVLNRGGRFENHAKAYKGNLLGKVPRRGSHLKWVRRVLSGSNRLILPQSDRTRNPSPSRIHPSEVRPPEAPYGDTHRRT